MQYGLNKLKAGAGGLAQVMLGGSGAEGAAYAKELGRLQTGRSRAAQARKYDADADLSVMQRDSLAGLDGTLAPVMQALGQNPDNAGSYASILRAGQGNSSQIADAMLKLSQGGRLNDAVESYKGGNADLANFQLHAGGEKAYSPYSQNTAGSVLNESTGVVDQSNPIANSTVAHTMAQAANQHAGARSHDATAGLRVAELLTENARRQPEVDKLTAEVGATQALTRQRDADRASGKGVPAAEAKKAELISRGVPEDLASGLAYGTIKAQKDAMGLRTLFVDLANGQTIAEIDGKGRLLRNEAVYGNVPSAPPAGAPPAGGDPIRDPLGILQ